MTPIFTNESDLDAIVDSNRDRIVRVTHFGVGARSASGLLFGEISARPISESGDSRQAEVQLTPPGTTVTYTVATERFGRVQTSTWDGGTLITISLHEEQSLLDGAGAAYRYLFRLQQREGWTALRYVHYVPDLLDLDTGGQGADLAYAPLMARYVQVDAGRYGAWAAAGPKVIDGTSELTFRGAGSRAWRAQAPAATDIGTSGRQLVIEAWYAPATAARVRYVESSLQTPAFRYDGRGGAAPILARGTHIEAPTGFGMIVSATEAVHESEMVHDPAAAIRGAGRGPGAEVLERFLRAQVATTFDNIAHLLSAGNLEPQGVTRSLELADLRGVRVHVTHPEHADAAREEVRDRLGDVPALVIHNGGWRPARLVALDGLAWRDDPSL